MLLSTSSTTKVMRSLSSCNILKICPRVPISQSLGAHITSSFSTSNKDKQQQHSFRPRRQTPKHMLDAPTPKIRSKKSKAPINLTKVSPNDSLESIYGHTAATAIRHIRKAKQDKGVIHKETVFSSADEIMRAADYLTAATGSTEDLVGERRGLMMDAWDLEHAEKFQKELDEVILEQSEFAFQDIPWKEDGGDSAQSSVVGKSNLNDTEEDPNQKAFGPWSETIVRVDRVQKVQRGGTMVRYRALVVGGTFSPFSDKHFDIPL